MRVAHIIMTYKNPYQLERLIRRMNHPQFDIYIHLDKKVDIAEFAYLKNIEQVVFIKNRRVCNWGGFSFVKAITESVREILSQKVNYQFINLMSAQDYPIKPVETIYQFFLRRMNKSFISYEESNDCEWWGHAVTRYELYHFTDINIKGRYLVQGFLNRIAPKRQFPIDLQLYGSAVSSWWTITSDCAQYIVNYLDENPRLLRFMRLTWAADEFLYASIIMNSPFKNQVVNNNLRYIEWEDGKPNPKILNTTDINVLKNSDHLFARKFDTAVDIEILDELDKVINYNKGSDIPCPANFKIP